jgi:Fic family protein
MTTREFLNSVISANISDDVTAQAQAMIANLDKRNAKRASTPSKTAVANEPIKASIVDLFAKGESKTASEVAVALTITTQKASALLRQLVENGTLTSTEVKVPKKGKCKAYTLAE